jgi:hypothetical protein
MTTKNNTLLDTIHDKLNKINSDINIKNRIPDFNEDDFKIIKNQFKFKLGIYAGISLILILVYIYFYKIKLPNISVIYVIIFICICSLILIVVQLPYSDIYNYKIYVLFLMFFITCVLIYYFNNTNTNSLIIKPSFVYILSFIFIIAIIGLAIFYRVFLIYLKKQQGILGIIINLIFFIPCLFNDILEYFKEQFKITTNTTFLLLLIEFFILFIYFYFYNNINSMDDKYCIMKNPVYLNEKNVIADNTVSLMSSDIPYLFNLTPTKPDFDWSIRKQLNNYSISFWLYINQNNENQVKQEYNIFKFSENPQDKNSGRPTIIYNNRTHTYTINCSNAPDSNDSTHKINVSNVPNQRWNYFVFIYFESNFYLYINGVLENKIEITNFPINIGNKENITIGEKDGLKGAICNIHFYNYPLKKSEIAKKYNILRLNNPPI